MTSHHKDDQKSIFRPVIYSGKEHLMCKIAKSGFGRPQTSEDAMQNSSGQYYLVKQHIKTSEVSKSEEGASWENAEEANQRFLEIYGPQGYDSYRWEKWFIIREGIEKFNALKKVYGSYFNRNR